MLSDLVKDVVSTSLGPVDLKGLLGTFCTIDDFVKGISFGSSLSSFSKWSHNWTTENGTQPCSCENGDVSFLLEEWCDSRLRFDHSSELPHLYFVLSHSGAATHFFLSK